MKEFVLFFRMDITSKDAQPSPEQMQMYLKQWDHWINSTAAKNMLAEGGNHLSVEGKVLKPGNEIINGLIRKRKNRSQDIFSLRQKIWMRPLR